jgi:hypothetical protein
VIKDISNFEELEHIADQLKNGGNPRELSEEILSFVSKSKSDIQKSQCVNCNCKIEKCYSCFNYPAKEFCGSEWIEPEMFGHCVDEENCFDVSEHCKHSYESLVNTIHSIYKKETIEKSVDEAREDLYTGIHLVQSLDHIQLQHVLCEDDLARYRGARALLKTSE